MGSPITHSKSSFEVFLRTTPTFPVKGPLGSFPFMAVKIDKERCVAALCKQEIGTLSIAQIVEDKMPSQRRDLETAKQMLHQSRGSLGHLKWIGIIMELTLRLKNDSDW